MSWQDQVNSSDKNDPYRILIYGIEGVGKTTFAAGAPNPIFLAAESGVSRIKPRPKVFPGVKTWDDFMTAIGKLTVDKHPYKTVVIDSADWLEKICHAKIIGTSKHDIVRVNGGWGAGYRESENLHRELIGALTTLFEKTGMNIVVTAHYQIKPVKDPEAPQDYDGYAIKCHDYVSALWREFAEAILFAKFETLVKSETEKEKVQAMGTGRRILCTQHSPTFQAKNRFGLPAEMEISWAEFEKYASQAPEETSEDILVKLREVVKTSEKSVAEKITKAVQNAKGDLEQLKKILKHALKLQTEKEAQ